MSNEEFTMPETVGTQETPVELYDGRVEGEPFDHFRERRKKSQEMVDEYLKGRYIDKNQPSFRILTRLAQGKRTMSGLSKGERQYITHIIGVPESKLRMFVFFKQGDISVVYPDKVHDMESSMAIQNVEIGNRNYRWL